MIFFREKTSWSAHNLSKEIYKKFDNEYNLVYSSTWTNKKDHIIIYEWLKKDIKNKILFLSLYDPIPSDQLPIFDPTDESRIIYINSTDFCFWLLAVDRFFLKYDIDSVKPIFFKNKFLCYQRKPFPERKYLYKLLKKQGGVVTIGDKNFDKVNFDLPEHVGFKESDEFTDTLLNVPNDIWSLGNIDIWNQSFLNIVSETITDINKNTFFLSEKIFKPIIGMRPFICYGHPNTSKYLNSLGFETFDDDFGFYPENNYFSNAEKILDIVRNIDTSIYKKLLPKILHNKYWFKEAVKNELNKLDNLAILYTKT